METSSSDSELEEIALCKETFRYITENLQKYHVKKYFNCHGQPIMIEEKVVVTVRYLATGNSFRSLAFSFQMGVTTVSVIIKETVKVLWKEFSSKHLPIPTTSDFLQIANDYYLLWNFPHCVGSIDGKHIRIKNPEYAGSNYYNYKHFFSFVLQAVVDANYKFIIIDVGNYGKQSDSGTFCNSAFYSSLTNGTLKFPKRDNVPGTDFTLPYVVVGDEAYPLLHNLLTPYSRNLNLNRRKVNFNSRLSRARRTVECAFGIIFAKWRILSKMIETKIETGVEITKSICLLHNLIINKDGIYHHLNDVTEIISKKKKSSGRPAATAKDIRDKFCEYFDKFHIVSHQDI